eukprot:TRINITY_DN1058_c0_g1_i1.p1 TRINITY_DN1058_c0_g1~~TRINITY_DN1058_c0_g1_i1.p1  ORF type:complete len:887 (+),score=390.56 TRINITY_DN1058_c0_g1_i1:154-2814(+)
MAGKGMKIELPEDEDELEEQEEEFDAEQAARDRTGALIDRFLANLDAVYQSAVGENRAAFDDASVSLKKANAEIVAPLKDKARQAESSSIKSYLLDIIDYLQDVLIHKQIITARKILHNPFDEKAHENYWKILQEVTNRSRQALEAADDINDLADDEWLDQHEAEVGDEATPAEFLLSIVAKEWAQLLRAAKRGNAQKVEEFIESCTTANQEAVELIIAEEANAPGVEESTKAEIQASTAYLTELLSEAFEIARLMCAPGVDPSLQDYFKAYDQIMEDMMEHVNDVITFTTEADEEQNGITSLADEQKTNLKLLTDLFGQYLKSIKENSLMGLESTAEELLQLVRQIINDAEELAQEIEDAADRRPVLEASGELSGLALEFEDLRRTKKTSDETYPTAAEGIRKEMHQVLVGLYKEIAKQRRREAEAGTRKRTMLQAAFKKEKAVQTDVMKIIKKLSKEKAGATKKKLDNDFKKLMLDMKGAREKVAEHRLRSDRKKKRILAFRKRKHRRARENQRVRKLDLYEQLSEQLRLEKESLQRERDAANRRWVEFKRTMVTPARRAALRAKREADAAEAAAAAAASVAALTAPAPAAPPATDAAAPAEPPPSGSVTSRGPGLQLSASLDSAGVAAAQASPAQSLNRTMSQSVDFSRQGVSPLRLSSSLSNNPDSPVPSGGATMRSSLDRTPSEIEKRLLPLHQSPMGTLLSDKSVMMTARRMDSSPNLNGQRDPNTAPAFNRPESNLNLIANLPKPAAALLPSLSGLMRSSSSGMLGNATASPPPQFHASPPAFNTSAAASPPAFRSMPPAFNASPPSFNAPKALASNALTPSPIKAPSAAPPQVTESIKQLESHDGHIQAAHRKQMLLLKRKALAAKTQSLEPVASASN